jgi:hypothetical protein
MTIVEMLVATAATLMLMGAIAQVFSVFGSAVTNSRSMIEQDARLRSVAWRLRTDLAGATARTLPPVDPTAGEGYVEIIEGSRRDGIDASGTNLAAGDIVGDIDDILLFTTSNSDTPFLGKAGSAMIESPCAEVAWFLRATPGTSSPTTYTLFRRQLLVVGYAGFGPFVTNNTAAFSNWSSRWNTFYDNYDISVRREGSSLVPNTLADLTRHDSRFLHNPDGLTDGSGFPYTFNTGTAGLFFNSSLNSSRVGEDVVLTNVIAFDIRVFDPAAPVSLSVDAAAVPGDPGFSSGSAAARGCYVDLGNGTVGVTSHFSSSAQGNYRLQAMGLAGSSIWDTWSSHYEANGVDEDGLARADQGTNGLDDTVGTYPQNGQVDEPGEQETSPPYPFPLRGLEVRLRVYEPTSRQVRQVTVRHTFVPH